MKTIQKEFNQNFAMTPREVLEDVAMFPIERLQKPQSLVKRYVESPEYVENLADYYRTIMVYREKDFINIQEEIDLVVNFTFLLKKRYEHGFHVKNLVPPDQVGYIMPLALQMLLENAVKHNIISTSQPLVVEIFIEKNYVVVRNNIQPKIRPEVGTHFGLQSLQHRYQLTDQLPVIIEKQNNFFTVKIPIRAQKQ